MNKADLITDVARKAKISKAAASACIEAMLKSIRESLSKGKNTVLVGFGTFTVGKRSARMGRNPQTKAPIRIPASKVPRFRAGKDLRAAVKRGK